jgi:hypothetical protein
LVHRRRKLKTFQNKSSAKPEALEVLTFLKHNPPSLPLDKFLLNSYRYKLHKGDDKAPKRHEVKFFQLLFLL